MDQTPQDVVVEVFETYGEAVQVLEPSVDFLDGGRWRHRYRSMRARRRADATGGVPVERAPTIISVIPTIRSISFLLSGFFRCAYAAIMSWLSSLITSRAA